MTADPSRPPRILNLALQGGGAHGAFTWGVLDYLLEDGRMDVEGISATSAGTMNALCVAQGLAEGTGGRDGRELARATLAAFWEGVSRSGAAISPVNSDDWDAMVRGSWLADWQPLYVAFDMITRAFSPYQFNPSGFNPLRPLLEQHIDFDRVRAGPVKLFISATNTRTGRVKVFQDAEITPEAALASACLPTLYQAVEVDGESYWDGGFAGNPALWPLFYFTKARDILIVHINPIERTDVPHSANDIHNRVAEISFNSSLLHELRAISFAQRLIREDWLKPEFKPRLKDVLMHAIRSDKQLARLAVSSKFNTHWQFLSDLRDRGRAAAAEWVAGCFHNVGERSSIDLVAEFL